MILLPWLISNASWLAPTGGWIVSEILGAKSGGDNASVTQCLISLIKAIAYALTKK